MFPKLSKIFILVNLEKKLILSKIFNISISIKIFENVDFGQNLPKN